MKKGFTLAEVLITLVIIGVIASMTIPTLMNSTNQQEYRVGLKKGISALNQALSLNYALDGKMLGDTDLESARNVIDNLFTKRMSVITTRTSSEGFASNSENISSDDCFYTADGMRYAIRWLGAQPDNEAGENYYAYILIDTNGEKGPNTITSDSRVPRDTFIATLYGARAVAGKAGDYTGESQASREVMFDKKVNNENGSQTPPPANP